MLGTFTPEVASNFQYLRHAVQDVSDGNLRDTMTSIVNDLVRNLEDQMLLVFANCAVERHDRERLLQRRNEDASLLEYYKQSLALIEERGPRATEENTTHEIQTNLNNRGGGGAGPQQAADDGGLRLAPDAEAAKAVLGFVHCLTQSVAFNVQAEKACLHVFQRSTGTLKVLSSIPDTTLAQRGATTASHHGVIGACFSTGLAIRCDTITPELRKVMYTNRLDVTNVFCVPVTEPIKGQVIGVLECMNKSHGASWTQGDESQLYQTALLAQYFITQFGQHLDLYNATPFNPVHLNNTCPYHPGYTNQDLAKLPGGATTSFRKQMLVARIQQPEQYPPRATRHTSSLFSVENLSNVRELAEYLELMDNNMRTNIAELVASKQRESDAKDQIQRLTIRVKVLEENSQRLEEQLTDAKRVILAQKMMSGGEGTARFDGAGTYRSALTHRHSLTQRSLQKQPLTAKSHTSDKSSSSPQNEALLPPVKEAIRPTTLHEFMHSASLELEKLQKKVLSNADASQRHRILGALNHHSNGGGGGGRSPPRRAMTDER